MAAGMRHDPSSCVDSQTWSRPPDKVAGRWLAGHLAGWTELPDARRQMLRPSLLRWHFARGTVLAEPGVAGPAGWHILAYAGWHSLALLSSLPDPPPCCSCSHLCGPTKGGESGSSGTPPALELSGSIAAAASSSDEARLAHARNWHSTQEGVRNDTPDHDMYACTQPTSQPANQPTSQPANRPQGKPPGRATAPEACLFGRGLDCGLGRRRNREWSRPCPCSSHAAWQQGICGVLHAAKSQPPLPPSMRCMKTAELQNAAACRCTTGALPAIKLQPFRIPGTRLA
jgi:hypothetical protein